MSRKHGRWAWMNASRVGLRSLRAVTRYDFWILWLIGSVLGVAGFIGALGSQMNWQGFTALSAQNWAILGAVGIVLIVAGAYGDKPALSQSHVHYRVD
jgi:hypothetical protein